MGQKMRNIICGEEGLGTVELVMVLAVLVGIALVFRHYVFDFVDAIMKNIFGTEMDNIMKQPLQK
ncbi:MAG: Flp1 family type IVb pilin [Peptococcaceae bacterium]|nr:hypothetical protein [Peptococcaceae bacterium]MDH7525094.1 Flp1 family type IVb pilin [Peptococcaceae bacterium]